MDIVMKVAGWVACGLLLTSCTASGDVNSPLGRDEQSSTTPTVEASAPVISSPTPSEAPRTASINFSGDLLWHNTLWESATVDAREMGETGMNFLPQLAPLTSYVSAADVAICHSEVPFAPEGGPFQNYPLFAAPPVIAEALPQVGWDVCTTASNHSLDTGFTGLERTIAFHEGNGILTSGTYATEEESRIPTVVTTDDGVRVAVVSSTYGTNGIPLPADAPWSVNLMDIDDMLLKAKQARQVADIVVVHMHAGTEYQSEPNGQQLEFAEAMTASPDVDLLIGQHAHVVQPITTVNGKWVAYGAGNLIAQSNPRNPRTYDGYLATFTFTEKEGAFVTTAAEFAPTFITRHSSSSPARVVVISEALEAGFGDPTALADSAARTRATVTSLGAEGLTEH